MRLCRAHVSAIIIVGLLLLQSHQACARHHKRRARNQRRTRRSAPKETAPCTASTNLSYPAPHYFPFPPFRVVLERTPGACDLAAPRKGLRGLTGQVRELLQGIGGSGKGSATDDEIRAFIDRGPSAFCSAFTRGDLMMPEPFVVQAIASFLTRCRVASTDQHQAGVLALRLRLSCRLSVVHSCSCAFRWRREVCTAGEHTLGGVAIYCKGYCIKRAN